MRNVITFPIRNGFRIDTSWPIKLHGRSFYIKTKDGISESISVTYEKLPITDAPKIIHSREGNGVSEIRFPNSRRYEAERDVRSWQALIASYQHIEIDYNSFTEKYYPESGETGVDISNFSRKDLDRNVVQHDFSIFGRAFLAIERGYEIIER